MTNTLVGDVYQKIIEEVVHASSNDFEESGVMGSTLQELQQEWQAKLSARQVAQMPWDPKPQPPPQQPPPSHMPSAAANGMSQSGYPPNPYASGPGSGDGRIKIEPGMEQQQQYTGLPNVAYQNGNGAAAAGGLARAQHLVQQQYGAAGNASINAMQQRGGLALPGQQTKPQGLSLPAGSPQQGQQSFQQQQAQAMAIRQQQQLAQQQAQPRIKVEHDSPQLQPGSFNQQPSQGPNYSQTDGADEGLEEWKAMLAERRAVSAEQTRQADRMMHEQVKNLSANLQSGLMVPLNQQPKRSKGKQRQAAPATSSAASSSRLPTIPQLDGELDEEEKPEVKDDDDENAINSDLDDSDDEGGAGMGDDDDEEGDNILCTYDKVQRVKNKWKCTLKDGVMSVNGKEWVFHKGMGEFEW